MKTKIFKVFLIFCIIFGIIYLISLMRPKYQVMTGETMNTYYRISIRDGRDDTLLHNAIRDELMSINNEMSVFENTSDLSQFNKNTDKGWIEVPPELAALLKNTYKIYTQTNGYFDPSVGGLVDIWGFGNNKNYKLPTDDEVKEAKKNVGLNQIIFSKDYRRARKNNTNITLNLSAIAKGYAVDRIAKLLEKNGYKNFIVDIGGEVRAKGNRDKKEKGWNLGIARPTNGSAEEYEYIIRLQDMSVATSGDYRNYFYVDGKRYSHTINPKTGYPVEDNLASVTVFTKECVNADALATGIMSMGTAKGMDFANRNRLAVIMFIHTEDDNFEVLVSNEAKDMLKKHQTGINTEEK